jgi:hypothetical protein
MCCGTTSHHGWGHHAAFCGCMGSTHFGPCFATREEKTAWLEKCLESLREEAKAVEERIAALNEEM